MFNGIVSDSAIQIIAFLLVVGGAFGIMIRTGAIEAGLVGLIRKAKGAEKLLIPVLFVLFSLGGAVFGMGEEALPFTMILCPLFVAVGYDTVIAVLVTYVATQIGFGASWMNPFSVGIAQGIAGIDVFSGAGFRMAMWVVFTALGCGMTMFYAAKVKKHRRSRLLIRQISISVSRTRKQVSMMVILSGSDTFWFCLHWLLPLYG